MSNKTNKKVYKITFYAELSEDDVRAMNKCFYDALDESMDITEHWGLKLENNESYTVFLYDKDTHETLDMSTYDDKEEAIYFAAERGWSEVVDDNTGEVVWTNNYKGEI